MTDAFQKLRMAIRLLENAIKKIVEHRTVSK